MLEVDDGHDSAERIHVGDSFLASVIKMAATRVDGVFGTRNVDTAQLLGRVVDVIDARNGKVRLRTDAADLDAELADVRSVKTVRAKS